MLAFRPYSIYNDLKNETCYILYSEHHLSCYNINIGNRSVVVILFYKVTEYTEIGWLSIQLYTLVDSCPSPFFLKSSSTKILLGFEEKKTPTPPLAPSSESGVYIKIKKHKQGEKISWFSKSLPTPSLSGNPGFPIWY